MKIEELKMIDNNINLDDYYYLYNFVKENMENPSWLGVIPRDETEEILKNKGKIWIFYNNKDIVCSMFYIPVSNKTLVKHNIEIDNHIVGSLGPIMVNPNYVGNGLMNQMMKIFEDYNLSIGNKYIFTKACTDNIYSTKNMEKNNYKLVEIYENERGKNSVYLKEL